ncbi:DctP family TRAP transporter solute-binding subunit [Azospira sp. I09]|jgi:C4-dicarboxylate-binding protein DctP|uniref:DctP family TRAP transporter solute-binding subunit n=1 Tax=Azospira sp. I09 TaxID=1765049 RepID=UPI0012613B00|nr:DctP family TRAP transporter solute-binding subunit [Azospira sp. I09]BBN89816.1 hypothetical protein AZSP09_28390 [Azospira sp. I09]BBN90891.1 hypothetical protein AZSP09_39140 [Azospira sp. I09]HPS25927.1 DctP family TRAP transporter solute-binding subunit [Bacteroidales bacterium]
MAVVAPKGITGLAFWDNGFRVFTCNKPIHRPSDLKGQKVRIQSSKVAEAQMRGIGAMPQVLAFGEVYNSLMTGVVDCQENPATNIYTQKFYEVQKHLAVTNHAYHGYVVIVNKKFWDGLPPDIRSALDNVMKNTTAYYYDQAKEEDRMAMEGIKKAGKTEIYTPNPQEIAEWKQSFTKVHKEMEGRYGKEILNEIYKVTGKK